MQFFLNIKAFVFILFRTKLNFQKHFQILVGTFSDIHSKDSQFLILKMSVLSKKLVQSAQNLKNINVNKKFLSQISI